jgi:pyridoxamine 5'-phosphate oxidase
MTSPLPLFLNWYAEAQTIGLAEPTSMVLATSTGDGKPSARVVLLKEADERGFTFFTNLESQKGQELLENPQAALCFYWMPLKRQVRVEGSMALLTPEESDAYYRSRHPESRIGAWASQQSRPLPSRAHLEAEVARYQQQFAGAEDIPRPAYWQGVRVVPRVIEFWDERPHRLHHREQFTLTEAGEWESRLLFP